MRFVDHDQANVQPLERLHKPLAAQFLRTHIHKARTSGLCFLHGQSMLAARHARMQAHGADTYGAEIVHLVLHQRDQRRHHHGDAGHKHGRHLKGDRLAPARGQQTERVGARKHRLYYLGLHRAKPVVAPIAPQYVERRFRLPPVHAEKNGFCSTSKLHKFPDMTKPGPVKARAAVIVSRESETVGEHPDHIGACEHLVAALVDGACVGHAFDQLRPRAAIGDVHCQSELAHPRLHGLEPLVSNLAVGLARGIDVPHRHSQPPEACHGIGAALQ